MNQPTHLPLLQLPSLLGIKENDCLFIGSDISNWAQCARKEGVAFDVNAFIDSIQQALPQGTIVIPAYTDNLKNGDTFDSKKSKPTTGALSNKIQKRTDFSRTADPLHSVFVWGKDAEEILSLSDKSTFGENSIFGFLHRKNAKMILIDVHFQDSFTFVHYVEERLKVAYRKNYFWKLNVVKDSKTIEKEVVFHTKKAGIRTDLYALQEELIATSVVQSFTIAGSQVLAMDVEKAYNAIVNFVSTGKKMYQFSCVDFLKFYIKKLIRK